MFKRRKFGEKQKKIISEIYLHSERNRSNFVWILVFRFWIEIFWNKTIFKGFRRVSKASIYYFSMKNTKKKRMNLLNFWMRMLSIHPGIGPFKFCDFSRMTNSTRVSFSLFLINLKKSSNILLYFFSFCNKNSEEQTQTETGIFF